MRRNVLSAVVVLGAIVPLSATAQAAELALGFPLNRSVLQTNESVPVSVIRSDAAALGADTLTATINGDNGSVVRMTFPVPAIAAQAGGARATQFFNLDARLLRPGHYTLQATANGATAAVPFDVYSHLRRSTYKLINWGSPKGAANQQIQGEGGLGYNLMYDHPADLSDYIRAGVDVVPVNIMSGGHQMDLRSEADWSDPYVTRGGTRRVSRAAFQYRSFPNFVGLNFYDEPGLTWHKHPVTGEWTPHGVPSQERSFESSFGSKAPQYNTVDPKKPADVAAWTQWGTWKLGFMDSAWREAAYGVSQVDPNLISNTQSQYGWTAFTDGYYFNVTRSLPVASGHGGYDDLAGGYYCPSYFLEMARARDRNRPNWYLPTWYNSLTDDTMRLENNLSFAVGIQGLMTPPWVEPTGGRPSGKAAVLEGHKVMARLGTIFDTLPSTPHPVALLYSMSNNLHLQTEDRGVAYAHGTKHGAGMLFSYLAGELSQQPVDSVVEEDILDGTLAAKHKAVVLASLVYLDPAVITALEQFAAGGGLVLKTSDTTVNVKGAIDLGVTPALPDQAAFDKQFAAIMASANRDWTLLQKYQTVSKYVEGSLPLAKAMTRELAKAGIAPVFGTDNPEIVAQKHGGGDVEYLFAINATNDKAKGTALAVLPSTATLRLPADGRPVYDAVTGEAMSEGKTPVFAGKTELSAKLNFIPGELKVLARTARPIGGVKVGTPVVSIDSTREADPIRLSFAASFVDTTGKILTGSVPLQVQVMDPLGATRYDLYRATTDGVLHMALPLAANDAAGTWTVKVTELLSSKSDSASFTYKPAGRNGNIMGETRRAIMFKDEEQNLFRFARAHRTVTIVPGTGAYQAAAERLQKILSPWGVQATIMDVATASKARTLTEDEARTWIGLDPGVMKAGDANPPAQAGIAVRDAVILLGTPDDNTLIKMIQAASFLPFKTISKDFPGQGRGYVAWQRDAVGPGQESVTLIGTDAAGIDEAVGTFYDAVAGLQPLTRWTLPVEASVAPATKIEVAPVVAAKVP